MMRLMKISLATCDRMTKLSMAEYIIYSIVDSHSQCVIYV